MADKDTLIEEHLDAIAAGIDLTDAKTQADTIHPAALTIADRERRVQEVRAAEAEPDLPWWQPAKDILDETLTGTLINNALRPHFNPDPEFTDERFEELVKEAIESGFPAEWAPELADAYSEEHFNYLVARAERHLEAQARIAQGGWGMFGANFLANVLDPASLAIGYGIIGPAFKLQQALKLSPLAQRGVQAAAGALTGAAVVGAEDAAGQQPETADYLFAVGLGGLLGGTLGPLAQNPATRAEAAALARAGQKMMAQAEELIQPPPLPKPVSEAGVQRAADAATAPKPKVIDDPERVLEAQIEANRLAVEEAKAKLKTLKRGSPEAEEVRLAAVAANKEMAALQKQLDHYRNTGELPENLRPREVLPEEAPAVELPDEIADALPDPAIVQAQLDDLRTALRNATDEETVEQLEAAIGELQAQLAPPQPVGAAVNPNVPFIQTAPDFLGPNLDDWRALKPGDVPRPAAASRRIDRAGRSGTTDNEAAALVFYQTFNDSVGKVGHARTPFSTDQVKDKLFLSFRVPFYQARMAQYPRYAAAMGYNRISRVLHYGEFDRYVGIALRSGDDSHLPAHLPQEAREAILTTADGLRKAYADILAAMQEAKLPGALETKPDPNYMPRRFDKTAIRRVIEQHGVEGVEDLVRIAIKTRHDDLGLQISDSLLRRLSKGYAKNVINRAYGVGDEWTIAISNGDRQRLAALLRDDAGLDKAEIDEVMRHLWSLRDRAKARFGSLNQRVLLDEFAQDPRTGLSYFHLLDNDANRVFLSYANQAAGHIALAKMQLRSPVKPRMRTVIEQQADGTSVVRQIQDGFTGGDVIFDGIRTAADEQRLFEIVRKWGADNVATLGDDITKRTEADIRMMKFAFDRLRGIPDEREMGNYAQFLRDLRNYNFIRLMWQGGLAQSLETGIIVGSLGMKAAFSQVPAFRRIIDAAGNSRLQKTLFDELERIGIGTLRMPGMAFHHQEQLFDDLPLTATSPSRRDRISNALQYGTQITNEYSGMGWVTQMLERWAAAGVVQRFADMADRLQAGKKLRRGDLKRAAQLDLDEKDLEAIFEQLRTHASKRDRVFFKGVITELNLDKWEPTARAKFENALFRFSRKLVQTGDLGNTAHFMSDPNAKTFLQFRNFTFTAWQNHTLYNLHMRDLPALMSLIWGFGWAAAVRGAQVKAIAALRPDTKEYEEKHLTTDALVRAAFQRTGTVSILPALIDTVALFTGQGAMFDARHTGQPTDVFGGSPPISFAKGLSDGIGGAIDALVRQRPISQAEVRAIMGSFPLATAIPFMAATSHLVKDLPKRAPQRQPLLGD